MGSRRLKLEGADPLLVYHCQSEPEQDHIVKALRFELGKVETPAIRERMVYVLSQIDETLASRVAEGLGIGVPRKVEGPLNMSVPADGDPKKFQPKQVHKEVGNSPALSMENTVKDTVRTRKVAADFIKAIAKHRNWACEKVEQVPA